MYICDFSRSVGAGSATTRNTRGLTRSVRALIVPPFPAPSRPSKTTAIFSPLCLTHSWSFTNSTCNLNSSRSYVLRVIVSVERFLCRSSLLLGWLMRTLSRLPGDALLGFELAARLIRDEVIGFAIPIETCGGRELGKTHFSDWIIDH